MYTLKDPNIREYQGEAVEYHCSITLLALALLLWRLLPILAACRQLLALFAADRVLPTGG